MRYVIGRIASICGFREAGRWLLGLVSLICAAGVTTTAAEAQGEGLVYEKQLALTDNPTPARGDEDAGPLLAEPDAGFYEQTVNLPALVPHLDGDGGLSARILEGTPARPGAWPSAVNMTMAYTGADGRPQESWCGATLIGERWILTAAHCMFRKEFGGLRTLKWVTAYENSHSFRRGRPLRVKAVYVHREWYDWRRSGMYDIALLELERNATAPRQKLASNAGRPTFLAASHRATIVGWGNTRPEYGAGSASKRLLEAKVPIVEQKTCVQLYRDLYRGLSEMTEAAFCAGTDAPATPGICYGDSGGPIFATGNNGEAVQVGISSFFLIGGRWCAQPAGYASVGFFEKWIREKVPDAVFVLPGAPPGALEQIAGVEPAGPPSPYGQCTVDILADGARANRVKVGSNLTVHVTTGVTGRLAVFNRIKADSRTAGDRIVQLFPNSHRRSTRLGLPPTSARAGDVVAIPAPEDGFSLTVSPPEGRYEIVAVVVPEGVNLADITKPYEDRARIDDFDAMLARIAEATRQVAASAPRAPRAVCTRQFDVVAR